MWSIQGEVFKWETRVLFFCCHVLLWRSEGLEAPLFVQLYFDLWDCKSVTDVFSQTASE